MLDVCSDDFVADRQPEPGGGEQGRAGVPEREHERGAAAAEPTFDRREHERKENQPDEELRAAGEPESARDEYADRVAAQLLEVRASFQEQGAGDRPARRVEHPGRDQQDEEEDIRERSRAHVENESLLERAPSLSQGIEPRPAQRALDLHEQHHGADQNQQSQEATFLDAINSAHRCGPGARFL